MCSFVLHTLSYLITIAKVVDGNAREETVKTLKKPLQKLLKSKKALAVPVTYLILFVSLIAIISVTYSYAVVKIKSRGSTQVFSCQTKTCKKALISALANFLTAAKTPF